MASSGNFYTSGYTTDSGDLVRLKFSWTMTQDLENNTSTISWKLTGSRKNNAYVNAGGFKVTIDGETVYSKSTSYRIELYNGTLVASGTKTLTHNSDGTRTFEVYAEGGLYYYAVNCTGSETFTLDSIPRASTITSASNVTLGNACSVKWTPLSTAFYYKLVFELGDTTKTVTGIAPGKTTAYIYTGYEIPLSLASEIPSAKTGTMKVTLTTHTADSCTSANQVGSADSENFTVTVPENSSTKPDVSMTISPVTALDAPFDTLYIKGKTKVQASFTGSGKYGADIDSYKVSVDGKSYDSPYKSGFLSTIGDITITGTAKDSRGFTNTDKETITVIDYSAPKLLPVSDEKAIVCGRCDEDGNLTSSGTCLKIRAKRSYSKVTTDGEQNNFCTMRYRIVQEGSKFSGDTGWVTILAKTETSDEVTVKLDGVVASVETAYVVQLGVIDDVGDSAAIQFSIPTDFVTIDVPEKHKGRRIGIFRYAQDSDELGVDFGGPIFGGSIDSLKLGTRITATETTPISLNDIKTPGCYYSPNAVNSQYITDSPYSEGGFGLIVRELQSVGYIRQELFYARTTWIRHFDGTVWSDWWRYQTTTVAETAASDYVIETGTSGGWTYKKWKGGTYQAFGIFTVTPTSSTINGALYRTNNMTINLPFAISSAIVSGTAVGYYWITNGGISGDSAVTLRLMSDKEFSTTTAIEVRLEVVGIYG